MPNLEEGAGPEDYLAYAALNNPGLEAAFHRWRAALERVPQAEAPPEPRLTYAYFIREVETRVGPQQHRLGLSQRLPWFGKLDLRGRAAREAAESARQHYEARKLGLFYAVRDAYFEHYYVNEAIGLVRAQRDLLEYLEGVVRARYRTAQAAHADLVRAQVELASMEDRLQALRELAAPVAARLNAALNRPLEAELPVPGELPHERIAAPDAEVLRWVAEGNPDLRALAHEAARRADEVRLARKDFWPDLTVGVDWVQTGDPIADTRDAGKDPIIAMVSVNLPIWREKLNARVREAGARRLAILRESKERENDLLARARMVLYEVRDAERRVDLYENVLMPKTRQSLKASEAAYRTGAGTFLDLVEAARVLLEFALARQRAITDHAQRLAELEMLAGRAVPRAATAALREGEKP
ncbi:MAG: TolC family protein [Candidatus Brocadiaceae bacterium]|jgi:outer membrane protein TolC